MKRRLTSMILCIAMFMTILPRITFTTAGAENDIDLSVAITHDGAAVSEITFPQNEKVTLTAELEGGEAAAWQWQLLMDAQSDQWVSVYDQKIADCELSYAMVRSLLDASDSTYVRCAVTCGETVVYSDPVCVTVLPALTAPVEVGSGLLPQVELEAGEMLAGEPSVLGVSNFALRPMAEEDEEYVTITIKYLDYAAWSEDRTEAAIYSPYTAILEKGKAFTQDVVSPTFLGFAPYYDPDNTDQDLVDAGTISLDYPEGTLNESIELLVFYKPIEVPYAIRYFFQNVNNDLYTERVDRYHTHKAETGTIISDDELKAHAGDTTGFSKLYHFPESVAADGSTVFECYYDRNYYLLQFDLNGGYGVEPLYARYGTPFVINDPVRHGYEFVGWDLVVNKDGTGDGQADTLPSTIPAEKQKYIAIWETIGTTYTVVYWKENADDNGYTYWGNAKKQATSADYVDGEDTASDDGLPDAEYFTFNGVLSEKDVLVEGDGSTVVNVYYTRNYYTITFRATGMCTIPAGHTHSDTCYDYICDSGQHIHTEECLDCIIPEHTHGEDCCTVAEHIHNSDCCSIPYHTHSDECCTKQEHIQHDKSCCTLTVHDKHSVDCWEKVDAQQSNKPNNAPDNPLQGQVYRRNNRSYIYINGSWYRYGGTESSGTTIPPNCHTHDDGDCTCDNEHTHSDGDCTCSETVHDHTEGNCNAEKCTNGGVEHTHGDEKCICLQTSHQHDDGCYSCGNEEHTHTEDCLRLICGIPEDHSHEGNCNYPNRTNTVKTVYRKYQQSLEDLWPLTDDNGETYDGGERWSPSSSSYYSEVLVHISSMPPDDFVLTLNTSNNSTKTMNYYLQVLPGEEYDVEYGGRQYILHNTIRANYGYITRAEDFFDIKGFVQYASNPSFNNSGQINNVSTANFYYNRITDHMLQFNNNGILIEDREEHGIMYGASLESYYFAPDYPANLEPNAYRFAGWYTSPGCYDGTEVDWDTLTMPEGDLLLYAKWTPITHTVKFFATYDEMLAYTEGGETYQTVTEVEHGSVIHETVPDPERRDEQGNKLIFSGWFYMENGERKAFTPLDMPINRDLMIFADWSGTTPEPYLIQYVTKDANGNLVKVADDTTGFAYVGTTRTFTAKAGEPYNQLYSDADGVNYNKGYFPVVSSHSITMAHDSNHEVPTVNVFTFEYVKAEHIKYTVRYVDKETNTDLPGHAPKVAYTDAAVVTERFVAVEDYVPDAFYKRLVISVVQHENGNWVGSEENEIIFYYIKNEKVAFYAVHFMLQTMESALKDDQSHLDYSISGSKDFVMSEVSIESTGDIGKDVSITPQEFTGYKLVEDQTREVTWNDQNKNNIIDSGELDEEQKSLGDDGQYTLRVTDNGTELYIFYTLLRYPYRVNYYLYNSTTPVPVEGSGSTLSEPLPFGYTTPDETAKEFPGYVCVSANTTQNLTIRAENDDNGDNVIDMDEVDRNVITFYYSPLQYVVEYVPVTEDMGTLSSTIEVITGQTGFDGSTPTPKPGYAFEGWYTDPECTVEADGHGTVDKETGHFTPAVEKMSKTESNIFYAKFVPLTGDLTITRGNAHADTTDDEQVFVYEVKNNSSGEIIYVTIVGNDSVTIHDLLLGEYTVTQMNDWSWRYGDAKQQIVHESAGGTTVTFDGEIAKKQWLDGNSPLIKNQKGKGGGA